MKHIDRVAPFTLALLIAASSANAQHESHDHEPPALTSVDIGTVDFQTSCKPEVKDEFNRGVSLLHSFAFARSRTAFEQVLKTDAACAIAYWGIALTHWGNPFGGLRTAATIDVGKKATDLAQATGTPTARERGYIDAVAILFSNSDAGTQRQRVIAYETAMEKTVANNPQDTEAKIFTALAIAQAALPDDKTYSRQLRAGAILEPLFERMPNHPGLAHYIIHAYDVPPLAPKALNAARAYADIAPAVPHALHMPSHTFTRVGMWQESVATNIRSADTAERGSEPPAVLHALDYMTYAYLQMAMDSEAKSALERLKRVVDAASQPAGAGNLAGSFPAVAMPARYAMERQRWADAAQLSVPSTPGGPYVEAMIRFARAIGAARSGKLDAVGPELERLGALRAQAVAMKDPYWAEIIDIQRRGATAWHLFAQGKKREGIVMMREAAQHEDATEKSVVTPGPLAPAREMLGFMLLESSRPEEALLAFDAAIVKEPNRFLALYGAGRAAEEAQQIERAKGYYQQLVKICAGAASDRAELAYARKMTKQLEPAAVTSRR
jgi:tetratricopeptide (TPR) repeat protein